MWTHDFRSWLTMAFLMTSMPALSEPRPAVVELFTSQGCSSCPPAEAFAGELALRPDVLVLTFHVTYWDELGWRDRFGLADATRRQQGYAQSMGSRGVYTPQAIVDGTKDLVGSNRAALEQELRGARTGVPVGLRVHDGVISIDIPSRADVPAGNVLLVSYLRSATSSIGRGENSGRTIRESNIVRSIMTLGQWQGAGHSWQIRMDSLPVDATDVAVLVQKSVQGGVLGAAHAPLR